MSLQGYVGNAQDAARIRRLEEKRQKEKADFEARACAAAAPCRWLRPIRPR